MTRRIPLEYFLNSAVASLGAHEEGQKQFRRDRADYSGLWSLCLIPNSLPFVAALPERRVTLYSGDMGNTFSLCGRKFNALEGVSDGGRASPIHRPPARWPENGRFMPFVRLLAPKNIDEFLARFKEQDCLLCIHDHETSCFSMFRIAGREMKWMYNEHPRSYEDAVFSVREQAQEEGLPTDSVFFYTCDESVPVFDQGAQA